MTYCAAISVQSGLVFIADSRTNAGADNLSTYSKMSTFGVSGERQFIVTTAGNLATSQAVLLQIEKDIESDAPVNLMNVSRMSDAAAYIGSLSVAEQRRSDPANPVFESSFLIGGEIAGARCRAFMVYPEGNFIPTSVHTPFLQLGETKYGKPILDRVIQNDTGIDLAALCALLSMDATTRSNATVGPPIELCTYVSGSLQPVRYVCFEEDHDYLRDLRQGWSTYLRDALHQMPAIPWPST